MAFDDENIWTSISARATTVWEMYALMASDPINANVSGT
jgi:hypothetical protein